MFVWGCPCLSTGVDLAIGLRGRREFPCRGSAPAVARDLSFAGPLPRRMAPWKGVELVALPLPKTPYLAAAWALLTSRLMAQMKAASSRAIAVMATVFNLPFLISAR